ncbi:MAG: outer membrane beta-barrel protein [Bacteroidota bacterium]
MKTSTLLLLFCVLVSPIWAQQQLKGVATDTLKQLAMQAATVTLLDKSDSTIVGFTRTNKDGAFTLSVKEPGNYLLLLGFKNYVDYYDNISIAKNEVKNLGRIPMLSRDQVLKEIVVTRQRAAIKIKGDTTEYVADSFKVRDNASVEELLKKLPGMQVDRNGNITAQGESVEKVLVDGEEFFSDDPKVVTRNLQANAVDKVQVFDKKSDQAQFTGIDDGLKIKTINLQLKEDRKAGYFGKFIAAAGPRIDPASQELAKNGYFDNQGMVNFFKGKRKIAVFEIVSNTGNVGLGWEDRDKFGGGNNTVFDEESGVSFTTGGDENWDGTFDGQGLPKVWTSGAHYSNKWNQDTFHVNANFRTSKQIVETNTNTNTQYILNDTSFNFTKATNNQFSSSIRHRLDGMFEWKIDSSSTLKISANGGINHSELADQSTSMMRNQNDVALNNSKTLQTNTTDAVNNNATAIWRKRFHKKGRTLSVNVDESAKNTNSDGILNVTNTYGGAFDSVTNQSKTTATSSLTLDANATYTEPLMKNTFIEFTYGAGIKNNTSERYSYNALANGTYNTVCDSVYSSHYVFDVFTQKATTTLKYNYKKMNVSIGMGASQTNFSQKDMFTATTRTRTFNNLFPKAVFTYTMQGHSRFVLRYSGATVQPTIDEIQPLKQNTDPLNIVIGNADLKQSFNNNYSMNFNDYKMLTGVWKYAGINFNQTNDGISTSDSITNAGRRFSKYINVDGNYAANFWGGMGKKIDRLHLTVGFNLNGAINNRNNYVNGLKNASKNNSFGFGVDLNYDKEDKFNLSLNPSIDYNANTSSIGNNNINYVSFQLDFNGNVTLPHHFELGSDFNWFLRQETAVFKNGNNIFKWNAYISKKLLKNDQLECRFYVNDILNQNIGYKRVGQSNYITETTYNNIKRYALVNLIWNFTSNPITNETGTRMHFKRRK